MSIPVYETGGHVVTPFFVTMTAYVGQYFIFVDPEREDVTERLENLKRFIMSERKGVSAKTHPHAPDLDTKTGRFTAFEVYTFLSAAQQIC